VQKKKKILLVMKKIVMATCLLLASFSVVNGQSVVKGVVLDNDSKKPIKGVLVTIKNTSNNYSTDLNGNFIIKNFQNGKAVLELKLVGYETQNIPIELFDRTLDLGSVFLFKDIIVNQDLSLITLTDDELNDDINSADNISGLLQASKDIFLNCGL